MVASLMGLALVRPSLAQTVPVRGIVFDSARRSALSNVPVALVTAAGSDTVALVASDHVGIFHFEAAPGRYRIVASKPGYRASDGIRLTLPAANAGGLLLPLEPLDALAIETRREGDAGPGGGPARVLAHIVDAETGRGVEGAEVAIAAPADTARGISDVNGYVALDEVPPLAESLTVRHLAYGDESTPLLLAAGSSYRMELTLRPRALELEGITATSRAEFNRLKGLRVRMARGLGGHFMLAEELEARSYPPLNTALYSLPSVNVRKFSTSDQFNERVFIRGCKASIFIDGVEVFNPWDDVSGSPPQLAEFLHIPTIGIEAIEVYSGAASLPPEFNTTGTRCAPW